MYFRVEDNDDVTPLFNSMSETLKDKYGDYYVAELIEAQDEHMHCLVAEASKKAFFFLFTLIHRVRMSQYFVY